jgi:hypothetical protein
LVGRRGINYIYNSLYPLAHPLQPSHKELLSGQRWLRSDKNIDFACFTFKEDDPDDDDSVASSGAASLSSSATKPSAIIASSKINRANSNNASSSISKGYSNSSLDSSVSSYEGPPRQPWDILCDNNLLGDVLKQIEHAIQQVRVWPLFSFDQAGLCVLLFCCLDLLCGGVY